MNKRKKINRHAKRGYRAQCRAFTDKGTFCRNSSSVKDDFLCGNHKQPKSVRFTVYEYKKILHGMEMEKLIAKRKQTENIFADLKIQIAGRNETQQKVMDSLPIEQQKRLRGLPIVLR